MRLLRVSDLASELDLLPGDMGIMLTLGRMAAFAQTVYIPESSTTVEISSKPEDFVDRLDPYEMRKKLALALQDYFYINGVEEIRYEELADLCLEVLEHNRPA